MSKGIAKRLAAALLITLVGLAAIPILVAIYRHAQELFR